MAPTVTDQMIPSINQAPAHKHYSLNFTKVTNACSDNSGMSKYRLKPFTAYHLTYQNLRFNFKFNLSYQFQLR